MANTFASQNLGLLRNDSAFAGLPVFAAASHVVRRPYPGGNDESIQFLGFGRKTAVFRLHLTAAEYEALAGDPEDAEDHGLIQTEGALVIGARTWSNATLLSVTPEEELINGDVRASCEFAITEGV